MTNLSLYFSRSYITITEWFQIRVSSALVFMSSSFPKPTF